MLILLQENPKPLGWAFRRLLSLLVASIILELWRGQKHFNVFVVEYHETNDQKLTLNKVLCSREQIQQGHWRSVRLDRPAYVVQNVSALLCGPESIYAQEHFDSWEWKPNEDQCEFAQWNKDVFCDLTRNQSIVFIGDSLSQEAMFSLGELLGLRNGTLNYEFQRACNATVEIFFRRDDYLRPSKVEWELKRLPALAVLNRGAHYVEDEVLMQDINITIGHVRNWQSRCAQQGRRCLLVWRTTVPGHPDCTKFNQPSTNRSTWRD